MLGARRRITGMDPLSASISSVFGLMATFFQERRGRKGDETQATIHEYIEWLDRGRHNEVVELLRSNQDLMTATERFMRIGQQEIIDRFDRLEERLAQSLISTPGWAEITQSLNPKARLSKQAVDFLRWFDSTGASSVLEFNHREGSAWVPMDGSGGVGNFEPDPSDARFFDADLDLLGGLELLIEGTGSKGSRKFTITREAVDLIRSIPDPSDDTTDNPHEEGPLE